MKPTQALKAEHEDILKIILILDRISDRLADREAVPAQEVDAVLDLLKTFIEQRHQAKEEGLLFPALIGAGLPQEKGLLEALLAEHATGRQLIDQLDRARAGLFNSDGLTLARFLDSSRIYIALIRQHVKMENSFLLPLADRNLSPMEEAGLEIRFEQMEEEQAGPGQRDDFHEIIEDLSKRYLV